MAPLTSSRKPRKLPYDGVKNGWYATLPEPAPARILEGDIKADWLVLGGGAAAYPSRAAWLNFGPMTPLP